MKEELVQAGRTLVYDVFTSGRSRHPTWAGQVKADKSGTRLAKRLAQAMRHHEGRHPEFQLLKNEGIKVDDESALTNFFVEVLKTFKGKLGYSDKEKSWFLKADKTHRARGQRGTRSRPRSSQFKPAAG